jgi:branched-chain amino acid transport system permease protein
MSDLASSAAPPRPVTAEKLKFYGIWITAALVLMVLPKIFSSGGALTTFSLIGVSVIFSLSYNILLGQTGMMSFGQAVY